MARSSGALGPALRGTGSFLLVGGGAMALSAVVAGLYGEVWTLLWFAVSAAGVGGLAWAVRQLPHDPRQITAADAMATAGMGWAALAVLGALPFLFAAHLTPEAVIDGYVPAGVDYGVSSLSFFRDPLHAVFESMSGWTTTGLTMTVHEPSLPHGFLIYRSLMQWAGGAGIIVLALTVFEHHGGVQSLLLYRAEGREQRLRPSIVETARRVWRIYVLVTAALAVYLLVAILVLLPDYPVGAAVFDAVNHAMTGQATGGFSTLDDSIAGYGSYGLEMAHLVPMVSGAIALPVHYLAYHRRSPSVYARDVQNRALAGLLVAGSLGVPGLLLGAPAVADPIREGVFQFVSALSGTGWQTSAISDWPDGAVLVVTAAMIIGGAAGATVGGIKLLRLVHLIRAAWWRVQELTRPSSAVKVFKIGQERLSREDFEIQAGRAAVFTVMWLIGIGVSVVVMTEALEGSGFTLADMIFESATAQDTVGLSAGITGPAMDRTVEAVFIAQMWLGRLEIIPVVMFIRALLPNP